MNVVVTERISTLITLNITLNQVVAVTATCFFLLRL